MTSTIKLKSSSVWWTLPTAWDLTHIWEAFINTVDESIMISKWDWTYFKVVDKADSTYTLSNVASNKVLNADSYSIDEIVDILWTLLTDLKTTWIIK